VSEVDRSTQFGALLPKRHHGEFFLEATLLFWIAGMCQAVGQIDEALSFLVPGTTVQFIAMMNLIEVFEDLALRDNDGVSARLHFEISLCLMMKNDELSITQDARLRDAAGSDAGDEVESGVLCGRAVHP